MADPNRARVPKVQSVLFSSEKALYSGLFLLTLEKS